MAPSRGGLNLAWMGPRILLRRQQQMSHSTETLRSGSPFASYTITTPPTQAQLAYANDFFVTSANSRRPHLLKSSEKFLQIPQSSIPEVAFLGRSNVGKSSLLNALLDLDADADGARVSARPGRTRTMNAFGLGVRLRERNGREEWIKDGVGEKQGGLVVVDMPGYGHASRSDWGTEIIKYLKGRRQYVLTFIPKYDFVAYKWKLALTLSSYRLRRAFVLVDAEHAVTKMDVEMFTLLWENLIPHQIVASKADKILFTSARKVGNVLKQSRVMDLSSKFDIIRSKVAIEQGKIGKIQQRTGTDVLGDVLGVSGKTSWPPQSSQFVGIGGLRWAILEAAGLAADANGARSSLDVDIIPDDK